MKCKPALLVFVSLWMLGAPGAAPAGDGSPDPAGVAAAFDEEWSNRLMFQEAMIDEGRKRLDRANAAYARAVAGREAAARIDQLAAKQKIAETELREAEAALPRLVAEAREEGVSEDVLKPYRFAVAPADTP